MKDKEDELTGGQLDSDDTYTEDMAEELAAFNKLHKDYIPKPSSVRNLKKKLMKGRRAESSRKTSVKTKSY